MITNFEQITEEISPDEMELIPILISGLKIRTKQNPIKAPDIVDGMRKRAGKVKMTEARLRKLFSC